MITVALFNPGRSDSDSRQGSLNSAVAKISS